MNGFTSVDIIIPVYNAYEDLTKCISSIFEFTDMNVHRIVIINDNSTDGRIAPYLDSICGGNLIVIHNDKNMGFSSNINIGIKYSEHDVILLNSDTIVTKNWIEKLQSCAYAEDEIGTVTPLSNSATLASVPVFGENNPVPHQFMIDEMAELVERCSMKVYPKIPVAVGFCMYIKRCVISEVGLFDAETFGRGYGEENDFCYRAELYGYKNILCDNTYIYHKGTGSFLSSEKEQLIQQHVGILEDRYPKFMRYTHTYCMRNPHQYIRDNLNIYLNLINGKRNILYVLHTDFEETAINHVGGTQLHVRDLVQNLSNYYNFFILSPDKNAIKITAYVDNKKQYFRFPIRDSAVVPVFFNHSYREIFNTILDAFRINIVHIHHIQELSLDIFYSAHIRNIPIAVTIHDYYFVCPTIFLYSADNKLCANGKRGDCKTCLKTKMGISDTVDYTRKWQLENSNALALADKIIFPSENAKEVFLQFYDSLKSNMLVIPHGLTLEESKTPAFQDIHDTNRLKVYFEEVHISKASDNRIAGWAFLEGMNNDHTDLYIEVTDKNQIAHRYSTTKSYRVDVDESFSGNGNYLFSGFEAYIKKHEIPTGNATLRLLAQVEDCTYRSPVLRKEQCIAPQIDNKFHIAFIGGLSLVKGSDLAYAMIKDNYDVNWYIFGNIDPQEPLYRLEQNNLYKFGMYKRNEIKALLHENQIDLVCILSKCSETFCYTLSETVMSGIPVLALDVGAVGSRIEEMKCGWTMPLNSNAGTLYKKIISLRESSEYQTVKKHLETIILKSARQMAMEYHDLYKSLSSNPVYSKYDAKKVFAATDPKSSEVKYEK